MTLSRRHLLSITAQGITLAGTALLPAPAASAQPAPRRGGTLVYANCSANRRGGDLSNSKHPYFMIDLVTRSAYDSLLWVDEQLQLHGELAKAWGATDDRLDTWEFVLHEGVHFHDGREMTAADVVSSFKLHQARHWASAQIAEVSAVGKYKLRFRLNQGNAEFPYVVAEYDTMVMPADANVDRIGLSGIGTGPFRIVSVDPQRRMVLERNESYWRTGLPYLDRLEVVNREGQMEAAINGFRARQFDAVLNIDPRLVRQLEKEPDTEIVGATSGDHAVIVLPKHPGSPFNDRRIRQALALAVDREAIVRVVYGTAGWVGNDSHLVAADPNFVARPLKRDVASARKLLAQAGFPNGITLPTLYYAPQWPEMPRYFQVLQQTVKEAGIILPIEERPSDGYSKFRQGDVDVTKGDFHKFAYTAVGPRNPGISLFRMQPRNNESGYWSGPEMEQYLKWYSQAMTTRDEARRKALYAQMQALLQKEVPALLPAGRKNLLVKRTQVRNLKNHPQHWSIRWDEVWKA